MAEKKEKEPFALSLYFWLQTLVTMLVALVLVFMFLGRLTPVDGHSMEPTLRNWDWMLVQDIGYTPAQGDVVVLTKKFVYADGPIVKRVIATGGQQVEIDYSSGTVYVDGAALDEPYILEPMRRPTYDNFASFLVPEGSIFVMGDNRNNSADSRALSLGAVDTRCVLGRAVMVIFPFGNFGPIS